MQLDILAEAAKNAPEPYRCTILGLIALLEKTKRKTEEDVLGQVSSLLRAEAKNSWKESIAQDSSPFHSAQAKAFNQSADIVDSFRDSLKSNKE